MVSGVEAHIDYLFNKHLIERIPNNKLTMNGKGRIYNQDKPPSKILWKAVCSLYKKQFPKESKPKGRITNVKEAPEGSAKVLLKFNEFRRVDKHRFLDFERLLWIIK